jgi:hypothetical protein
MYALCSITVKIIRKLGVINKHLGSSLDFFGFYSSPLLFAWYLNLHRGLLVLVILVKKKCQGCVAIVAVEALDSQQI